VKAVTKPILGAVIEIRVLKQTSVIYVVFVQYTGVPELRKRSITRLLLKISTFSLF
jgi:hypothetical protein